MTNDEVDRLEPTRKFVKAITNETRFSILLLITANREATLDQISEFVNKSKSTVHHHIQQLLFSGFIREITKPGSKTRYYQRIKFDINEKMSEAFNYEKFLKESPETQEEIKNLLAELSRTNFIMMTNALEFLSEEFFKGIEDLSVNDQYTILGGISAGVFYLSEENFIKFKQERKELVMKYMKDEREHSNRLKPHANYFASFNLDKVLKRKFKQRKK